MDQPNINFDPQDLVDILNEEDDNIYSLHPVALKSSNYFEFDEFLTLNSSPQFYNNFFMLSLNIRSLHGKYEELEVWGAPPPSF